MEYLIIGIVAAAASALTFFSGFGLGTILTPVFLLFFPVELAIALTGIIHLLNNFFKIGLVGSHTNVRVAAKFGLSGVVGAFLGASLLFYLSSFSTPLEYRLLGFDLDTNRLNITIAVLLLFFAMFEVVPGLRNLTFPRKFAIPGGLLSGFFGGLSGHQGALRSAFLIHFDLKKEAFIATGIVIACFIDITRLGVYWNNLGSANISQNLAPLLIALVSAFGGAVVGKILLKKVTLFAIQVLIAILISLIAILLLLGLI